MSTLKMVNRSYVRVVPKPAFWEALKPLIEDEAFVSFHEPTIYLMEEECWDEQAFLEKYFAKIAQFEYEQHLSTEDAVGMVPTTQAAFMNYFHVEFGSTLVDLIRKPDLAAL